jgi:hypothetical protein
MFAVMVFVTGYLMGIVFDAHDRAPCRLQSYEALRMV